MNDATIRLEVLVKVIYVLENLMTFENVKELSSRQNQYIWE
jgi:hypothetical protein